MTDEIERLLDAAAALADLTGEPVVVIGGVARSIWAPTRATVDLDVVYGGVSLREVIDAAPAAGLVAVPEEVEALAASYMTRLRLPEEPSGPVRLDVIAASHPFYERVIARSEVVERGSRRVRVASPEDVVLLKLIADRPQDRVDVQAIVDAQGEALDVETLRREAVALEIELPPALRG